MNQETFELLALVNGNWRIGLVWLGSGLAIVVPVVLSASFVASIILQLNAGSSFYCLSNLGVSKVPYVAYLFNIPLMITGVAVIIFAIALIEAIPSGKLVLAGAGIMVVVGVFVSLTGVFTSASRVLHDLVSNGVFVLFFISVIMIGVSFVRKGMQRKGYVSIATPIVTSAAGALAAYGPFFTAHACAAGEWTFVLGLSAWLIWMGRNLLKL